MSLQRIALSGLVAATIASSASARAVEQQASPAPALSGAHDTAAGVPLPPARPFTMITMVAPAAGGTARAAATKPAPTMPEPIRPEHARVARTRPDPAEVQQPQVEVAAAETPTASGPQESAAPTIDSLVERRAHDSGIPVGLAKAVVRIESRGNPRATNHGAMGLMQIKTDTARRLGFRGSPSALLVADTNLIYGMKVLAEAYRSESGDVCRTLAYYQSGHRVHRFSAAQRDYCSRARILMARS